MVIILAHVIIYVYIYIWANICFSWGGWQLRTSWSAINPNWIILQMWIPCDIAWDQTRFIFVQQSTTYLSTFHVTLMIHTYSFAFCIIIEYNEMMNVIAIILRWRQKHIKSISTKPRQLLYWRSKEPRHHPPYYWWDISPIILRLGLICMRLNI